MAAPKPITIWGHNGGPNPWKVVIICKELGIPYEHKLLDFTEVKKQPYTDLNPNGRVPAIEDPNTGVKLWESGAIVEYLIATYDKENKLSYPVGSNEYWWSKQWLAFQISGQAPYYGQTVYFTAYEYDDVARKRFHRESERVTMVLNTALKTNGTGYLVGNKLTYADLAFVPWNLALQYGWSKGEEPEELKKMFARYPEYERWMAELSGRESVKEAWFVEREAAKTKGH